MVMLSRARSRRAFTSLARPRQSSTSPTTPFFGQSFLAVLADGQRDEHVAQLLDRLFYPTIAACKDRLRVGQAAGQLGADIDLDIAVDLLYGGYYHRLLLGIAPLTPPITPAPSSTRPSAASDLPPPVARGMRQSTTSRKADKLNKLPKKPNESIQGWRPPLQVSTGTNAGDGSLNCFHEPGAVSRFRAARPRRCCSRPTAAVPTEADGNSAPFFRNPRQPDAGESAPASARRNAWARRSAMRVRASSAVSGPRNSRVAATRWARVA